MRNTLCIFLLLLMALTFTAAQTETLTILFTGNTHSTLAPIGERTADLRGTVGGIARAAKVISSTKSSDPNVITLHTGDLFTGDVFYNASHGLSELELMKKIGIDVVTLGNHEFYEGNGKLAEVLDAVITDNTMSVVSSNIDISDDKFNLDKYVSTYTTRVIGTLKVGIFGLAEPEAEILYNQSRATFLDNMKQCAQAAANELRLAGCDVVICLSHLRSQVNTDLASTISNIDLILGSNDHGCAAVETVTNPSGVFTWIIKTGSHYREMEKVQLSINRKDPIDLISRVCIPLNSSIQEDEAIKKEVDNQIALVENQFGPMFTDKIGFASGTFQQYSAQYFRNPNIAVIHRYLVTNAFREYTKTNVAVELNGEMSQELYKGPIVGDDLFRVFGYGFNGVNRFGFRLATFTLTGATLESVMEYFMDMADINNEYYPQVSGMTYIKKEGKDASSILRTIRVNDLPLENDKKYTITTNEFTLNLLKELPEIKIADIALLDNVSEYQAVRAYVVKRGLISPDDISIEMPKTQNTLLPPDQFFLGQNYPNPFNPSTTIRYALPASASVSLSIHDMLGREVATLVNEQQSAGWKEVQWNAKGLASGMYLMKILAGNFTDTKKILLMK